MLAESERDKHNLKELAYRLGCYPPHYPVPTTIRYIEPVCFFCGSIKDRCNRLPQDCLDNSLRAGLQLI